MTTSMGRNRELIRAMKFGFWVGTKLMPRRAVRWESATRDDGRATLRGRNWVEVLPIGERRSAERFFAADVELVGPSEWLDYYPAADEPICGWGRPRLPDGRIQHCPRSREDDQAFCRRHMTELTSSEGEEEHAGEQEERTDAE